MNGSSVVELRQAQGETMPSATGWAGGLFAEKGRAMASGGLQPAVVSQPADGDARPGQPASLTGAILGAKRAAYVVSTGSGGSAQAEESAAPVLAFVDPHTAGESAGEAPRPAPTRRRIRTAMRLDSERRRRLNLVAGFTGRTAQAVITAALQAYLRDLIPCSAASPGTGTDRDQHAPASSPVRGTQRSLRLHPHLYWRLANAARRARCSMQSILISALDNHLDTAGPAICAEVADCLMGWTGEAGTSTPRSKSRPAHWRTEGGRPLGRRQLRNEGTRGAMPRLAGF